jgi:hypothetical protein
MQKQLNFIDSPIPPSMNFKRDDLFVKEGKIFIYDFEARKWVPALSLSSLDLKRKLELLKEAISWKTGYSSDDIVSEYTKQKGKV